MNEQEYMNITSKIDENYVNEYRIVTAKHTITLRKRIRTAILVAAAVAVMVPVTVFAAKRLTHREKVSIYYGEDGIRMIEEKHLADGYTVENGKIRLTVDTQMCDGNFTEVVYTLTALTEDAKKHIRSLDIYHKRIYADTGEKVERGGGSGTSYGENDSDDEITWCAIYAVEKDRPTRIQFLEFTETGERDKFGGHVIFEDFTYFEGIYYDLLSEPNVPVKNLRSPDGKELTLSPYGVSFLREDHKEYKEYVSVPVQSFTVISTEGERIELFKAKHWCGLTGGGITVVALDDGNTIVTTGDFGSSEFTLRFGKVFNIDNISGVEINGVAYMEEE